MENQEKFIEMIQDVVALARVNRREVTKEFLKEFLKELHLSDEQMGFVYDYLTQENIKVIDHDGRKHMQKEETESVYEKTEEGEYLSLYLEELKRAGSRNQVDPSLYERAADGDAQAKSFIIEQKLARVIEIAGRFKNQGMAQNDLIQEGNIGLLLAVEQLEGRTAEAEAFLDEEIEKSMLQALDLYKEEKRGNLKLMRKAENLKNEMERLEEEMGGKMTSDDIAEYTGMDLEEIRDILRMTGEDL